MSAALPYVAAAMLYAIVNGEVPKYFRANDFSFHEDKAVLTASLFVKAGYATDTEVQEALAALTERHIIEAVSDKYTRPEYSLSEYFTREKLSDLPDGPSYYDRFATRGTHWLTEALVNIHRENSPYPIPDDPEGIPQEGLALPLGGALGLDVSSEKTEERDTFGFSPDSQTFDNGTFRSETVNVSGALNTTPLNAVELNGPTIVPAAGRYVSSKDNEIAVSEIRRSISDLITAINNDRTNDFEDREGRVNELLTLDFMLQQNQISVPLVEKILSETVRHLAEKFADNAVGMAAQAVISLATHAFLNGIQF